MTEPAHAARDRPTARFRPSLVARAPARRVAPVGCVALGLLAACASDARVGEGIAVDTLNGVVRIVNLASTPAASRPAAELSEAPLRIGRVDGEGPDVFGEVDVVAVGPDREVYVADGVALEIRVFSAGGEFLRAFGRQGEGPGEFEAVDGLVVGADGSVWVRDPRLARVSRFGPDGAFEDSFRLERSFFIFSDGTTFWRDSAGRVYDRIVTSTGIDEPDRYGLVVYAPDAAPDTVFVVTHRPRRTFAREGDRTVLGMNAPFSPQPLVAVSAGGTIAAGLGDSYRIVVTNRVGDTLRLFARELEADPVSDAEGAAALERLRARAEEMAPGATLDDVDLPGTKPSIVQIHADGRGGWWVGRYRGERDPDDPTAALPTEYDVFDGTGRLLGGVTVPPVLVYQIGPDYVAGVETDPLGVQYAVVYAFASTR